MSDESLPQVEVSRILQLPGKILGNLWPPERVFLGVLVCKRLRWGPHSLFENARAISVHTKSLWRARRWMKLLREGCATNTSIKEEHLMFHSIWKDVMRFQGAQHIHLAITSCLCNHVDFLMERLLPFLKSKLASLEMIGDSTEQHPCYQKWVDSPAWLSSELSLGKSVTKLDLSFINLGEMGLERLVNGFEGFAELQRLNITDCNIGRNGATVLSDLLHCLGRQAPKRFHSLDLRGNLISDSQLSEFAKSLVECQSLSHLDLSDQAIGFRAWGFIFGILSRLSHLQSCNFSNFDGGNHSQWSDEQSKFYREGALQLPSLLGACTSRKTLTYLDLSDLKLVDDGAWELASALRECSVLQQINLSRNNFSDLGVQTLKAVLRETDVVLTVQDNSGPGPRVEFECFSTPSNPSDSDLDPDSFSKVGDKAFAKLEFDSESEEAELYDLLSELDSEEAFGTQENVTTTKSTFRT